MPYERYERHSRKSPLVLFLGMETVVRTNDTNRERVNKGEDDPMRARMNQIARIWFKSWNAPSVVDGRS